MRISDWSSDVCSSDLDVGDPHTSEESAPARDRQRDLDGGAVRVAQEREAEAVRVEHGVALALPPVVADGLPEVAGAVEQPDAGERHAQVGRALEMVSGEDAETPGVLRHRRSEKRRGGKGWGRPWRS